MRLMKRHKYRVGERLLRSLLSLGIIVIFILTSNPNMLLQAASISSYTAYPPFAGTAVKPNVLINLDTSTSLSYFAYDFGWNAQSDENEYIESDGSYKKNPVLPSEGFNPAISYYGYFEPGRWYRYDRFEKAWTTKNATIADWHGNFLNWLTMRRIDIIKKALIGGKTISRVGMVTDVYHDHDLVVDPPYSDSQYIGYQKRVDNKTLCAVTSLEANGQNSIDCSSDLKTLFTFDNDKNGGGGRKGWVTDDIPAFSVGEYAEDDSSNNSNSDNNSDNTIENPSNSYKIVIHLDDEPRGVIQQIGENVRWGLQVMNNGKWTTKGDAGKDSGCNKETDETSSWDPVCDGCGSTDPDVVTTYSSNKQNVIRDTDGGTVLVPVGYDKIDDKGRIPGIVTEIANAAPYTPSTPLAESLWSATGYFMQHESAVDEPLGPRYFVDTNNDNSNRGRWGRGDRGDNSNNDKWDWNWGAPGKTSASYPLGDDVDPYNYALDPDYDKPVWIPCAKSFIITITDGEPTMDNMVDTTWLGDAFNTSYTDRTNAVPGWALRDAGTGLYAEYFWNLGGSHYVDEVALYSHVDDDTYRDLRDFEAEKKKNPDGNVVVDNEEQYLTHYFIYANFGNTTPEGKRLLNWSEASGGGAARNGGFIELGSNFVPDIQAEYDIDGDGVNDNFFNPRDGYQLEAALTNAVYDAIQAASGTAATMITNSSNGEGVVYLSYFSPKKLDVNGTRKWLGYIQALFIDEFGNLREDSANYGILDDSKIDKIIRTSYSAVDDEVQVYKCEYDSNNNVACPNEPAGGLESIDPLWDGGEHLWSTVPAERTIYTTTDGSTLLTGDFTTGKSLDLMPYLRASNDTEAKNIIEWIRGDDLTGITDAAHPAGYRQRDITINDDTNIWKLGDIIHSTPSVVGKPMENYDLLYGDGSYTAFRFANLKRRQVVYAGANDGMLHAFNAGVYDDLNKKYCANGALNKGGCISGDYKLGEELWAFIPRGLLPHLKWLTLPEYTHVYYVDLKPKITDVKVFSDNTHIKGWGTILIGGFRYGGKDINLASGEITSPEYFALDITNPTEPRLLWTFSDPGLGLSMSYPSVARVCNTGRESCEWFAIFGSGATDYDALSNLTEFQDGNVFVLNISGGNNGEITGWKENTNFWKIPTGYSKTFMANSITVDVDIDYDVDVVYIGENYEDADGEWNARMHRITTNRGTLNYPRDWSISTLADIKDIAGSSDAAKAITAAPSAAMDNRANLWLFFGTGKYLGSWDKNQTDTGAFYAIKDGCWRGSCGNSFTNLMDASGITVSADDSVNISCNKDVCLWTDLLASSYNYDGWALYFGSSLIESRDYTGTPLSHSGERVITKPLVIGGLVIWATYLPEDDACVNGGESNLYAVYYETGTAYKDYIFNEQEETGDADVARVKRIGMGMPSNASAQVTESGSLAVYVQQSTNDIITIEHSTPFSLRSETINWKTEQLP